MIMFILQVILNIILLLCLIGMGFVVKEIYTILRGL